MTKGKGKKKQSSPSQRSQHSKEPATLRFCNQREGVAARVLWVDFHGEEREYARLHEQTWYNQDTYVSHPWRLRCAATNELLAEYVGPTATITLLPDGSTRVQPGLQKRRHVDISHPEWGTFRKRGEALGIPILAFDCVAQAAVDTAVHVVQQMLADTDSSIVETMVEQGAEVAVIGRRQGTTDLPMYRHLKGIDCSNGGGDYDEATRGLGGNPGNPTTSCGEENLLMEGDKRYSSENILVHEFGHAVMDLGLHCHPLRDAIAGAYEAARGSGRYDLDCYMMANESEYWAEGTQAWFDATVREDVTSGVNTREKLKERDPRLAELMALVYGDGSWRYPHTAPSSFTPWHANKRRRTKNGMAAASDGGGGGDAEAGVALEVQAAAAAAVDEGSDADPLLKGRGRSSAGGSSGSSSKGGRGRVTRRKAGGSPRRGGSKGRCESSGLAATPPRRITRAFARMAAYCCCSPAALQVI